MSKSTRPLAKSPSEVLAAQLPEWRRFRDNLSAEQLARRVAALGGGLSRVAISEIENGRRDVKLDEALILAAALNVPPPLLWFPMRTGEHVRMTDQSVIHPDLALRWLAGDGPLAASDRSAIGSAEWSAAYDEAGWYHAARPLRLYDEHRRAQERVHKADLEVLRFETARARSAATEARTRRVDALRRLADVRAGMRVEGMTPPKLPAEWTAELKRLGIGED